MGGHPSNDPLSPFEKFHGIKPHVKDFKIIWHLGLCTDPCEGIESLTEGGASDIRGLFRAEDRTSEILESVHVRFGTSPTRSGFALEPSERVDMASLGRELLKMYLRLFL